MHAVLRLGAKISKKTEIGAENTLFEGDFPQKRCQECFF